MRNYFARDGHDDRLSINSVEELVAAGKFATVHTTAQKQLCAFGPPVQRKISTMYAAKIRRIQGPSPMYAAKDSSDTGAESATHCWRVTAHDAIVQGN